MSKGIYKYYEDYGRHGQLEGVFIADSSDVEKAWGCMTYMGEALGKHSEVYSGINAETVELLTNDSTMVDLFENNIGDVGYNPVSSYLEGEYLEEEDD